MKVGDEMILLEYDRGRTVRQDKVRVKSIGRLYFTVEPEGRWWLEKTKFHLETGREKSEYQSSYRVTTPEVLADEDRRSDAIKTLRAAGLEFCFGGDRDWTTDQIVRIAEVASEVSGD